MGTDKFLLFILGTILIGGSLMAGCQMSARHAAAGHNSGANVELLFEHEDVRVYRFYDGHVNRYLVRGAETVRR